MNALWLFATLAFADIAPPPGYVETCTVERACGKAGGETCHAWHGDVDACKPLADRGLSKSCQTRGASAWEEVWCNPGEGTAAADEPTPAVGPGPIEPSHRCGCDQTPSPTAAAGLAALLLLLRRRQRE